MRKGILINCMMIGIFCISITCCTNFNKEDRSLPPYELIKNNLKETDVSVAVEITNIEQKQVIRSNDGKVGYIIFKIDALVFECYKGNLKPGKKITYYRSQEAGNRPPTAGTKAIGSFNKENENLIIPDVAYYFSYSKGLQNLFKKAGKDINGSFSE